MGRSMFVLRFRVACAQTRPRGGFGIDGNSVLETANETVTAAGKCFNVLGTLTGIAESPAQSIDCSVKTFLEIDKCVAAPKNPPELLPRNHFTGMLEQLGQDPKGLVL